MSNKVEAGSKAKEPTVSIAIPKAKPKAPPMKRVSPGVYRDSKGELVRSKGSQPGKESYLPAKPSSTAGSLIGPMTPGNGNIDSNIQRIIDMFGKGQAQPGQSAREQGGSNAPSWLDDRIKSDPKVQGWLDSMKKQPSAPSVMDMMRGARPKAPSAGENPFGGSILTDRQRRERGIDPRDPNQYWIGPDGKVFGTLMGWEGMGGPKPASQSNEALAAATPQIPRSGGSIADLLRGR